LLDFVLKPASVYDCGGTGTMVNTISTYLTYTHAPAEINKVVLLDSTLTLLYC